VSGEQLMYAYSKQQSVISNHLFISENPRFEIGVPDGYRDPCAIQKQGACFVNRSDSEGGGHAPRAKRGANDHLMTPEPDEGPITFSREFLTKPYPAPNSPVSGSY